MMMFRNHMTWIYYNLHILVYWREAGSIAADKDNTLFVWTDEEPVTFLDLFHKTNISVIINGKQQGNPLLLEWYNDTLLKNKYSIYCLSHLALNILTAVAGRNAHKCTVCFV